MDYDFIEIGTSDFDTLIQACHEDAIGISIEPLQFYLDNLPNKKNVVKINAAMSVDGSSNNVEVYYIHPKIILQNGLINHLRGCNKIGGYHPQHLSNPIVKNNLSTFVSIDTIKQITFDELYSTYSIHKVKCLKIDTEGFDCYILKQFLTFLKDKDSSYYPTIINFETNTLTPKELVLETIQQFVEVGYVVKQFVYNDGSGSTELVWNKLK